MAAAHLDSGISVNTDEMLFLSLKTRDQMRKFLTIVFPYAVTSGRVEITPPYPIFLSATASSLRPPVARSRDGGDGGARVPADRSRGKSDGNLGGDVRGEEVHLRRSLRQGFERSCRQYV